MATFSKRPAGGYQAQVSINRKRISKTFDRLSDAKRWASLMEKDAASGIVPGSRAPLAHFLKLHQNFVGEKHKHPRHEKAVLGYIADDPIAELPVCEISRSDVEDWMERRRTIPSRQTGRIVKESTILRQLSILSSLFTKLVREGIIPKNPAHGVELPKDSAPRERVATDEEIERLKFVAGWEEGQVPQNKMQRVCAAFVLACLTGMRSGEMMRIERSWIRGRTLRIPAEATKTDTARVIALNDRALRIIEDVCSLGFEPSIWDLSDGSRDALWRKIRDKAGLRDEYDSRGRLIRQGLTFHDGRATFCTWAASPGPDGAPRLDVLSLARQTGHKNLKMLMRYYRPSIESFADRLN